MMAVPRHFWRLFSNGTVAVAFRLIVKLIDLGQVSTIGLVALTTVVVKFNAKNYKSLRPT